MTPLLNRQPCRQSDDNLIPLINIVFLLLIFFMVAGQLRQPPAAEVSLPVHHAQQPNNGPQDALIELSTDGRWYLNGAAIDAPGLAQQLAALPLSAQLTLRADRHTHAADLEPLLTILRNQQRPRLHLQTQSGDLP